jgi:hypothetical protein
MTTEEKLILMFNEVEGPMSGSCSTEIEWEHGEAVAVNVIKDGYVAWSRTKQDLLFDYMTRDIT